MTTRIRTKIEDQIVELCVCVASAHLFKGEEGTNASVLCNSRVGKTPLRPRAHENANAVHAATAPIVATVAVCATFETARSTRLRFGTGCGARRSRRSVRFGGTDSLSSASSSRFLFSDLDACLRGSVPEDKSNL